MCKLLDLALALPAQALPQFQMYRWAFVREGGPPQDPANDNNNLVQTAAVVSNGGSRCALTNSFSEMYPVKLQAYKFDLFSTTCVSRLVEPFEEMIQEIAEP